MLNILKQLKLSKPPIKQDARLLMDYNFSGIVGDEDHEVDSAPVNTVGYTGLTLIVCVLESTYKHGAFKFTVQHSDQKNDQFLPLDDSCIVGGQYKGLLPLSESGGLVVSKTVLWSKQWVMVRLRGIDSPQGRMGVYSLQTCGSFFCRW